MKVSLLATCMCGAFMTVVAIAQSSLSGLSSAPPQPSRYSTVDAAFMKQFAASTLAEIEAAKLASRRAHDESVAEYARRMIEERWQANEKLKELAEAQAVILPSTPDPGQAATQSMLEMQTPAKFDTDYLRTQVADHRRLVQLLRHEIEGGRDPNVRQFARETLPIVSQHLKLAKQLQLRLVAGESEPTVASLLD